MWLCLSCAFSVKSTLQRLFGEMLYFFFNPAQMTDTVHYRHLWKHSHPFEMPKHFCTELYWYQGLRTIHAAGGHQATNLLNPGKRESVPSAQQSRHGRSHGSRGTIITTKLRLRWIKRSSLLWGIRHRSGFSKVLFPRTHKVLLPWISRAVVEGIGSVCGGMGP